MGNVTLWSTSNLATVSNLISAVSYWQPATQDSQKIVRITLLNMDIVPGGQVQIMKIVIATQPGTQLGSMQINVIDVNGNIVRSVCILFSSTYFGRISGYMAERIPSGWRVGGEGNGQERINLSLA
jgi:hypothetical protein